MIFQFSISPEAYPLKIAYCQGCQASMRIFFYVSTYMNILAYGNNFKLLTLISTHQNSINMLKNIIYTRIVEAMTSTSLINVNKHYLNYG